MEEKRQGYIDLHGYIKEKFDTMEERVYPVLEDHSRRLSTLEKWFWRVSGGAAVLLFLFDGLEKITSVVVKAAQAFGG